VLALGWSLPQPVNNKLSINKKAAKKGLVRFFIALGGLGCTQFPSTANLHKIWDTIKNDTKMMQGKLKKKREATQKQLPFFIHHLSQPKKQLRVDLE
jgi:hypothetical protein